MRAELLLAAFQPLTKKDAAIQTVLLACKLAAPSRPSWWQWSVWLAAGITIIRIEVAG